MFPVTKASFQTIMVLTGGAVAVGYYFLASSYQVPPALQATALLAAFGAAGLVQRRPKTDPRTQDEDLEANLLGSILNKHMIVSVADKNGMITDVNSKFLVKTGYKKDNIVGQSVETYLGSASPLATEVRESLQEREVWQGETTLLRADGTSFQTRATIMPLHDENDNFVGSISSRTDTTNSRQAMGRSQLAKAMNLLHDDVWIVDGETHRFRYMNLAARNRFGWSEEDCRTKTLADIGDAKAANDLLGTCAEFFSSDKLVHTCELEMDGKNFQVTASRLTEFENDRSVIAVLRNITEFVARGRNNAQFVSTVSHELRSPLTSIKGAMSLLLASSEGNLSPKAKSLVEIAHRNAERLVLITNDILDLEKIAAGNMTFDSKLVNMSGIIREAVSASGSLIKNEEMSIKVTGAEQPLWVCTDPHRILQVLNNLLTNAIKFSPPHSEILVNLCATEEELKVTVTDSGRGISLQDHPKIFQRFADFENSDRANKGGTGLGLSICKLIIDGLGGTIDFDSNVGSGSSFYFTLLRQSIESDEEIQKIRYQQVG